MNKLRAQSSGGYHQIFVRDDVTRKRVKLEADIYIPSGNPSVNGVRLSVGGDVSDFSYTTNQWIHVSHETYSGSTTISLVMLANGSPTFSTSTDLVYFKDMEYTVYEGKTTDYLGEFIYENDEVQLIQHEEGRIVKDETTNSWEYHYHLKDHLGNTRTTFTTKPKEISFLATMETEEKSGEEALFSNLEETRANFSSAAHSPNEVAELDVTNPIGPAISLPVGVGDTLVLEGYAYYEGGSGYSNPTDLATFVASVAGAFGGINAGTELQQATFDVFDNAYTSIGLQGTSSDNVPAAYLNYIFFDENMDYKRSGFKQISSAANFNKEYVTFDDPLIMQEAGYVYCFVSMESTNGRVFWDDFKVTLKEHPVIQMDDYYPFGLQMAGGYQRVTNLSNDFKYNGKELIEDLDLEWYDYGWRNYDALIARFSVVDPMADQRNWVSPYNYVQNNPITRIDPTGALDVFSLDTETGDITLIEDNDDETHELVDSDTGETIVDDVDDGLLHDGQNIMKEGLESSNWLGARNLAIGISMHTNDEIGGLYYKNEDGDRFIKVLPYEHTTHIRNESGQVEKSVAGFVIDPSIEFNSQDGTFTGARAAAGFHTHPGHPDAKTDLGTPQPSREDKAHVIKSYYADYDIPYYIYGREQMTINGVTSNTSISRFFPRQSGAVQIRMTKPWKIN